MLKNGNRLSGDVLREKADSIVLDLGFAVLTVPMEDIQERRLESQAADLKLEGGPDRIYTEVDPRAQPERPVKALADELGGSVAVVQTPAALGSCFAIDERGYFVTNCHVIQGEQEISIKLFRKGMAGSDTLKIDNVQIVAMSPFMDLALLKAAIPPDVHLRAAAGVQRFGPERADGLRHRQPAGAWNGRSRRGSSARGGARSRGSRSCR